MPMERGGGEACPWSAAKLKLEGSTTISGSASPTRRVTSRVAGRTPGLVAVTVTVARCAPAGRPAGRVRTANVAGASVEDSSTSTHSPGVVAAMVADRPDTGLPSLARTVRDWGAVGPPPNGEVKPTALSESSSAGGIATVMEAVPDTPSTTAWIVAVPAERAWTTPSESTDATSGSRLVQLTSRPLSTLPDEAYAVASRLPVSLTRIVDTGGSTATDVTSIAATLTVSHPYARTTSGRTAAHDQQGG